jgi:hypothetical protein
MCSNHTPLDVLAGARLQNPGRPKTSQSPLKRNPSSPPAAGGGNSTARWAEVERPSKCSS